MEEFMEDQIQQADPTLDPPKPEARTKEKKGSINKKHKALIILLILAVTGGWFGVNWWIMSKTHIATDNAFVEARTVPISFKVSGTVKHVLVTDNQFVRQGDLLVELDERDFQVQVAKADAGVGMAVNETGGERLQVEAARATVQLDKARYDQSVLDLQRGEALFGREVIPKEQLDRLKTAKRVAGSQLKEADEGLKRAKAVAGVAAVGGNKARVREKQAQLEDARLKLSYTRITAPHDGYITRKNVEPGANVQAGQSLMALVPLQDAWIVANYKESQITYIRPGQRVEFTVDAYQDRQFTGRVDSIMAGTGAAFSLLPPENATGNYVKVVQRVPIKILVDSNSDPDHLLRMGMSVVPTVLVGRTKADILKELNPFK